MNFVFQRRSNANWWTKRIDLGARFHWIPWKSWLAGFAFAALLSFFLGVWENLCLPYSHNLQSSPSQWIFTSRRSEEDFLINFGKVITSKRNTFHARSLARSVMEQRHPSNLTDSFPEESLAAGVEKSQLIWFYELMFKTNSTASIFASRDQGTKKKGKDSCYGIKSFPVPCLAGTKVRRWRLISHFFACAPFSDRANQKESKAIWPRERREKWSL